MTSKGGFCLTWLCFLISELGQSEIMFFAISVCFSMIIHVSFFDLQELLLLEEDVKALEEMYPQGEQVTHEN